MAITSINLGKIKFNWKGAWALGQPYVKDDVVRYNGSSYVCITGHTSATSWATNSSKFELMVEGTTVTTTLGDIVYRDVTQDARLPIGADGQVLTVVGGVPLWRDNGVNTKIYYVSPTGSDSNSGLSWGTAFASIKYACTQAVGPATIYVASGVYLEQLPITVPSFVAVVGDNQRTTTVRPASGFEQQTMWRLGDGALLNKMLFEGLTGYIPYAPNDQNIDLATIGGIYVAFDPLTPIATKSPYVIECSAKSSGAFGALLDGGVHASGLRSMVFHGYTVILDNGVGFWVTNNAKSEIVSCFTYFCHIGYSATRGGKIRALNGNNSYGTYGALASGTNLSESTLNGTVYGDLLEYTAISLSGGSFSAGDVITGETSEAVAVITNAQQSANRIYYKITSGGPFVVGETIENETGVSAEIATGGVTGQKGFILIATGFSVAPRPGGSIEFTSGDSATYVIQSVSGWTNSGSVVSLVLASEKSTPSVDGVGIRIRYDYSNIRLTGHDFLSIGTGGVVTTNYPGVPLQNPSQGNEVIELFPARVFYVSTDQDGNFRVGEYFKVDQATGRATLNASAFDLSGLTSLRLGSIGAQLGEQINEFSSDATLSGNSNLAVPTEQAVKTYFTQVSSDIVPAVTNLYTLGTSSVLYDKIYVNKVIGPANLIIDPAAEGDNTGTVQIKGNLQVDGTTTTINSTTLTIDDKNIVLGSGAINDAAADGSGITVESGDGNKTFNWIDSTDSWTSSEHINLITGKEFKINGVSVLTGSTLGSGITSSSLTSVGTINSGTWNGNVVGAAYGGTGVANNPASTITISGNFGTTFTVSGATSVTLPTTGTLATTGNLSQFASTTSSQLAGVISDDTGTGSLVFGTSPTITTSLVAGSASFDLINTTATTVNFAGAANILTIGAANSAITVNGIITQTGAGGLAVSPTSGTARIVLTSNGAGSQIYSVNGQIPGLDNGGFAIRNETTEVNNLYILPSGEVVTTGALTVGAQFNTKQISETLDTKTGATGTVAHDFSTGAIWYHSSISANFTANFTNVPTTNNRAITVSLILNQGSTGYYPNAVQIDGSAVTIRWADNSVPIPAANKIDLCVFTLIRTGSVWYVVGNYTNYA
jgi:hypothetical protein